jgi:hypothetical protein
MPCCLRTRSRAAERGIGGKSRSCPSFFIFLVKKVEAAALTSQFCSRLAMTVTVVVPCQKPIHLSTDNDWSMHQVLRHDYFGLFISFNANNSRRLASTIRDGGHHAVRTPDGRIGGQSLERSYRSRGSPPNPEPVRGCSQDKLLQRRPMSTVHT